MGEWLQKKAFFLQLSREFKANKGAYRLKISIRLLSMLKAC